MDSYEYDQRYFRVFATYRKQGRPPAHLRRFIQHFYRSIT
jgi:hypothetical protein